MSFRVILERHAEEDFTQHTDDIARDHPAAAIDFIEAVEQALSRLADMPDMGSSRPFRHSRLEGIRMWPVPRVQNYLIFYRVTSEEIQVLRILHAAQDYTRFFQR